MAPGAVGLVDDDLAYVDAWGFEVEAVRSPLLLLHGTADGIVPPEHARWVAARCPSASLRLEGGAGHVSILGWAPAAGVGLVGRGGAGRAGLSGGGLPRVVCRGRVVGGLGWAPKGRVRRLAESRRWWCGWAPPGSLGRGGA